MDKPISPKGHALLDYSLAATLLTAPPLMGLSRRACTVFGALGLNAAAVNALTAQPLAVKPVIPFRTHKTIDAAAIPVYALLPVVAGAVTDKRGRGLWLATIAALVGNFLLTDWEAKS